MLSNTVRIWIATMLRRAVLELGHLVARLQSQKSEIAITYQSNCFFQFVHPRLPR
jgi:hypothetical protein